MITRIFYSKSPANTINYVMNPKKQAEIALSKGINSLFNVPRIIMDFEKQSALRPSLEVKVIHIPTSFHARDLESVNAHGAEILQDWIDRMERHGYHFDQYFFGRHHDKDHKNPHFHFVGNLVLDDGSRANLANIGKAAREASIYVTQKWGLVSAKHLQEEILQEQKDAMKEYEKADYILSGQKNSGHSTSVSSYDSTDIMVVEDTSAPFFETGSFDPIGVVAAMLFPDYTPVISSGGGGGNKSDDDEDKKKKKRRNTGRGGFSKR